MLLLIHPINYFYGNIVSEEASNTVAENNGTREDKGKLLIDAEDAELLERCRKGRVEAFGAIVKKYQDRIFNAILRICGNRDDAEELTQETFVKALENLNSFRQASQFYTWLFRIAMNLTITKRRRATRMHFSRLDSERTDGDQTYRLGEIIADQHQKNPHENAVKADINRRVQEALMKIDEQFRIVVVLCDIEQMGYEEISRVLNVPVGTVKSRLHRARNLLKNELSDLLE